MRQKLNKFYKENFGSFSNLSLKEIEQLCLQEQQQTTLPFLFFPANTKRNNTRKALHATLNFFLSTSSN
jgi:hypothetical protein